MLKLTLAIDTSDKMQHTCCQIELKKDSGLLVPLMTVLEEEEV
jgi:hypothetical protein